MGKSRDTSLLFRHDFARRSECGWIERANPGNRALKALADCARRVCPFRLYKQPGGALNLFTGDGRFVPARQRSGYGVVQPRGDQRIVLELAANSAGGLLYRIHQGLLVLASPKWVGSAQQILRQETIDRFADGGLVVGAQAFPRGTEI